ncbi:MAG: MFS transporter [Candidatus Micrarchaeaceae archaeon]
MQSASEAEAIVQKGRSKKYLAFLEITAFLGWAMVVYEWNLFGDLIGPVSKILNLNASQTAYFLALIQFTMVPIILLVGYFIDIFGRKIMYSVILFIASILTALTGFAVLAGLGTAVAARAGTQGAAQNEQSVAASLTSEEMPAKLRGFLYSIIQSGWPVGVTLAAAIVVGLYPILGFKYIWFIAVIPLVLIAVSRFWIKESVRFEKVVEARKNIKDATVDKFVNRSAVTRIPIRQAFGKDVRKDTIKAMLLYTLYLAGQVPVVVLAAYYMEIILHFPVVTATSIISIGAALTIPGYWINGLISEKIGRRNTGIIGTLLALAGVIWFATSGHSYILILSAYSFSSFWVNGNFANVINQINENVPTRVRGTVNVLSTALGQVGWGVGDLIYGLFLSAVGATGVMIIFSTVTFAISIGIFVSWRNVKPGTPLEAIAT